MSSYYEDKYYVADYFSSIEPDVSSANTNRTRDIAPKGKSDGKKGDKNDKGKGKGKPTPPPPPYFPSQFVRLVNEDEQTCICHGSPIIFTCVANEKGNFMKFQPETGAIILEDNAIFLVIYESQVYSTEPTACNHSLGLHLELDGEHIVGSGSLVRVGANEKVELVSHAIIMTKEGAPNILQLLNQSAKSINAFGANLTLLKIGEIKEEKDEKDENCDKDKCEK